MYKHNIRRKQLPLFSMPFGEHLSPDNKWVKLAKLVPWDEIEDLYREKFSSQGQGPFPITARMAFGALIIKEELRLSDRACVEQITENPYLQYFCGLDHFITEAPFDASMFVHFRKRFAMDGVAQINACIFEKMRKQASPREPSTGASDKKQDEAEEGKPAVDSGDHGKESETKQIPNKGKLLVDASCLPGDIRYPTDLGLLNEAREKTEAIIDVLHAHILPSVEYKKPRTYRERARKDFLQVVKAKRPGKKKIRTAIRKQLGYVRRNLAIIDTLLENTHWIVRPTGQKPLFEPDTSSNPDSGLRFLSRHLYKALLVISEVYRQQEWMYSNRTNRIDDRIVSISQPHIRPIKRGKARVETEFGAKIDISVVNGITFVDTISWDNFNEGICLIARIESFRKRFGHYPASVHADKLYRNRDNLRFCKIHGIRLSGPKLGRPKKETSDNSAEIKAEKAILRQDAADRNPVEGKFGQGKRRYSLGLVMTKLASTSESAIMIAFIVMNLKRWLAILLFCLKKSAIGALIPGLFERISDLWRAFHSATSKTHLEQMGTARKHAFLARLG